MCDTKRYSSSTGEKVNYFHENVAADSYIRPENAYYYHKWFRFTVGLRARGAKEERADYLREMDAFMTEKWSPVKRLRWNHPTKVQVYGEMSALVEREEMARRKIYAVENFCKLYVQRMRVLRGGTSGVWSPNEFQNFSMVRSIFTRRIVRVNRDGTRDKQVLGRAWGYGFRTGYRAFINRRTSGVVHRFYFYKCNKTRLGVGNAFKYSLPKSISVNSFVIKTEIVRIVNSFTVRYLRRLLPFDNVPHHILESIMLASIHTNYSQWNPENHPMHEFIEKVYKCFIMPRKPGVKRQYSNMFDRIRSAIMRVDQPERHKRLLQVGDVVDLEGGTYKQRSGEIAKLHAKRVTVELFEYTMPGHTGSVKRRNLQLLDTGGEWVKDARVEAVQGTRVGHVGKMLTVADSPELESMIKVLFEPRCFPRATVTVAMKSVVKRPHPCEDEDE